jgi:aminopeptidase
VLAAQGAEGELQTFRMPMLKLIQTTNVRHAHMVGINREIMCDGMCSDYKEIQRISRLVYEKVRDAEKIEVVTEKGCNFTACFSPELKWAIEDGDIKPGRPRNLPDGEVATCPIEVNGTAVIDGCLGDIFAEKYGFLGDTPMIVEIENGRALRESLKCVDEQLREKFIEYLFKNDENSNRVGEFAIGTNTGLTKLICNILQDEKFPGVHIAFGHPASPSETGADWQCSTHVDGVIKSPTIIVDGETIMNKGQFRPE